MRKLLLTCSLAAALLTTGAQTEADAVVWYMDGAAYVAICDEQTKAIHMEGGTMEEARSFTISPQDPADPFFYDVVGEVPDWMPSSTVAPDDIDGSPCYTFLDKAMNTVAVMVRLPGVAMLEDQIKGELVMLTEAEYKDAEGRPAHITEGSLQLPGEEGHAMTFGTVAHTPVNVMESDGRCWRFTATADGLLLRPVRREEGSGDYVLIEGGRAVHLIRQNGSLGRWPTTSSSLLQRSMLRYLDRQALRQMREEIVNRDGHTHLSKIEMHNVNMIQAEESSR